MIDVRDRFVSKKGILLPSMLELLACPAAYDTHRSDDSISGSVSLDYFAALRRNYPTSVPIAERPAIELLATPKVLLELDFAKDLSKTKTEGLTASWRMNRLNEANGFIVFSRSRFGKRFTVNALHSQSWGVNFFRFQPFGFTSGSLKLRATFDQEKANWTVSSGGKAAEHEQSYSPVFTASRLRFAQAQTPHKRFDPAE